jgi:hypothetical protein
MQTATNDPLPLKHTHYLNDSEMLQFNSIFEALKTERCQWLFVFES